MVKSDTSTDTSNTHIIKENDYVLLYVDERRRHLFRVRSGHRFSSDKGFVDHEKLLGIVYGAEITLSSGAKAYVLNPTTEDIVFKLFKRPTQVIYPKDIGRIILKLDVGPGKRILEAGVGSGVSTAFLAKYVAPNGKIYGYEIREDFAKIAMRNISLLGLEKYVEIKIKDISEGVEERDLDAALIDLPDPWRVLDVLYSALRPGAPVVFFLPTMNQVIKLFDELSSSTKWIAVEIEEILERIYETKKNAIRPKVKMIGHTGYIVSARKILNM